MRHWAAALVCFLPVFACGCVCACGNCAFIPALLVGGAVYQAQTNIECVPVRRDLEVVLKGKPDPTAPDRPRYQQASDRLEQYGRRANEVIDQEHGRSWRKPRLLAEWDYPTVLELTGRSDPIWSLSMAQAVRRANNRFDVPGNDGADERHVGGAAAMETATRRPVPPSLVPQLVARRDELDRLIAELKTRVNPEWYLPWRDAHPEQAATLR